MNLPLNKSPTIIELLLIELLIFFLIPKSVKSLTGVIPAPISPTSNPALINAQLTKPLQSKPFGIIL